MNEQKIRVGVAGFGMMGQMHLGCYARNPACEVVAVASTNPKSLSGEQNVKGNIPNDHEFDARGVRRCRSWEELVHDPEVDLLDLCLPTPWHARATVEGLRAGKHVLCEKPMALSLFDCDVMIEAQAESGKLLMIGHCLRFWPQYVRAHQILHSGELGRVLSAHFHRFSGAPTWSRWMMDASQSGGVVLDMHIHDIDTSLWWFGAPAQVRASGVVEAGLPLEVDAAWTYDNGPSVQIHGAWDKHSGAFRMGFEVVGERGTLSFDSSRSQDLEIRSRGEVQIGQFDDSTGYAPELDYFVECIAGGNPPTRATPQSSKLALQIALDELRQIGG